MFYLRPFYHLAVLLDKTSLCSGMSHKSPNAPSLIVFEPHKPCRRRQRQLDHPVVLGTGPRAYSCTQWFWTVGAEADLEARGLGQALKGPLRCRRRSKTSCEKRG